MACSGRTGDSGSSGRCLRVSTLKCLEAGHTAHSADAETDPTLEVGDELARPLIEHFLGNVLGRGEQYEEEDSVEV